MNIPVVYEDDWLIVFNKPAGLLTVPTPKNESFTLTGIINERAKNINPSPHLYPCHRLDRETSGLIIYAKGKSFQKKMMDVFKERRIKKIYIAFAQGNLAEKEGRINKPVEGLSASTGYKVLERKNFYSIVEVIPYTGRKNQIRIHFKSIGHPLMGEKKFAFRRDFKLKANRLCLHAKKLDFMHPVTGKRIILDSPLPAGMRHFLEKYKV